MENSPQKLTSNSCYYSINKLKNIGDNLQQMLLFLSVYNERVTIMLAKLEKNIVENTAY